MGYIWFLWTFPKKFLTFQSVLILFHFNTGILQDRKSKCKKCFPLSSSFLTFLEKKRKLWPVLRHQRERDTKVSESDLKPKIQLLSECKPEQSNTWNRENSARQIKMTDLSPFCYFRAGPLRSFSVQQISAHFLFAASFTFSPFGTWHFLSITSKAWLCICPLSGPADVLQISCFLPDFPNLVLQNLFFLIDFCTFSCDTRSNNSGLCPRASPWPGPDRFKLKPSSHLPHCSLLSRTQHQTNTIHLWTFPLPTPALEYFGFVLFCSFKKG